MFGKYLGLEKRRAIICSAAFIAILGGSQFDVQSVRAEESFGGAIAADELANIRGGDNDVTNSLNTTTTAASSQTTNATNENNSIGGDAPAGHVFVQAGSLNDNHGMTNVVMNTAPQSNVQGIMSLNVILH
jgi:hypothetical protein